MALTREQADKIEIDENVIVGFSGTGGSICAEQLAKWAYRRLETWPKFLSALRTAENELEQRYKAQEGSSIDKLALKIVKDAIALA